MRVPAEEAAKSNLLPDQVKISDKYGGGFPANVEGLHHLHCLVRVSQVEMEAQLTEKPTESSPTSPILQFRLLSCSWRRPFSKQRPNPPVSRQ